MRVVLGAFGGLRSPVATLSEMAYVEIVLARAARATVPQRFPPVPGETERIPLPQRPPPTPTYPRSARRPPLSHCGEGDP